jgi:hypothetical protein
VVCWYYLPVKASLSTSLFPVSGGEERAVMIARRSAALASLKEHGTQINLCFITPTSK